MKLLFILIPIFSFVEVTNPVYIKKQNDRLIQNTNINFDSLDFTKLEINFYQIGCFNHDNYRINFKVTKNETFVNLYGNSTTDCEGFKFTQSKANNLLVSRPINKEELLQLKDVLTTNQNQMSTMHNLIDINYNGAEYKFHDMCPEPEWKKFVYTMITSKQ